MRRAAVVAGSVLGRLAARSEPPAASSLAAIWQRAAQDVNAALLYASLPPAQATHPRGLSSTTAACSSSEPQPAAEESEGEALDAQGPVRNCWQCGHELRPQHMFFCPDCKSIQPMDQNAETKYFAAFGLRPGQFDVDPDDLERRYKQLQRRLHPDKFSTGSALEKDYAEHQAALVNQAYDVLKKPLRRAHYILQQQGLGACEGLTITDPELLMYVMEAREEVEVTEDKERLGELLEESQEQEERCIQELSEAFRRGDLPHAAEVTTQLRYVKRIQEAIIDKL